MVAVFVICVHASRSIAIAFPLRWEDSVSLGRFFGDVQSLPVVQMNTSVNVILVNIMDVASQSAFVDGDSFAEETPCLTAHVQISARMNTESDVMF